MKEILGHLLIAGFFTSFLVLSGCDNLTGDEGERGPAGASGTDAQPCTVTDNLDGTFTQACPGSASVTYGETEEPEAYDNASGSRGGQLYDKWWLVIGADAPTTTHAFYPSFGAKSGSDTWRCIECHGWDYIGKDGSYRAGSHYTGIDGLYPNLSSVWVAYKNIRDNHGYRDVGLTDADVWDLVKFYREELIDIYAILDREGLFTGSAAAGKILFEGGVPGWDSTGRVTNTACIVCHGPDGTIEFVAGFDSFIGKLSNENPQKFQHRVRFGHPGSDPVMPQAASIHAALWDVDDLSTYAQTLPKVSNAVAGTIMAALDILDSTGFDIISAELNAAARISDVTVNIHGVVEKALAASTAVIWPIELEAKTLAFEADTGTLFDALAAEDLTSAQAAGDAVRFSHNDLSQAGYEWLQGQLDTISGAAVMAAIDIIDTTGFDVISTEINAAAVFADINPLIQGDVEKALLVAKVIHWSIELAAGADVFETNAAVLIDALVAEDLIAAQAAGDALRDSQHNLSDAAYEWLAQLGAFSGTTAVMAAIDIIDTTGFHDISADLNAAVLFAEVSNLVQGNVEKALIVSKATAWPTATAPQAQFFETDVEALINALVAEDLVTSQTAGVASHDSHHNLSLAVYEWLASVEPGGGSELPPGPTVSFVNDVYPIFTNRICNACHIEGHQSGMNLSGDAPSTYLVVTSSRVDLITPANSLILLKPLHEDAGGLPHGGGNRFTDTTDVDYQTILTWITEGALDN